MTTKKLSPKQKRMLDFIRDFIQANSYPPSIRDILHGCGISSTSVVDYNLHILQREGHLHRSPDISRGIELMGMERDRKGFQVPLVGYIAAGEPLPILGSESWAELEPLESIEVAPSLVKGKGRVYALRVKGTSMIDALIDDGDIVLIKPTSQAEDGDMVVAWLKLEKEATLKRFYRDGTRIRLQPANSQMPPILVDPENLEIQGKVIGVVRKVS